MQQSFCILVLPFPLSGGYSCLSQSTGVTSFTMRCDQPTEFQHVSACCFTTPTSPAAFACSAGSNALGWPVAVLPHLSGADCVCILDRSCLFIQHYISHFSPYSSFILLPSGPASHCGWPRLSLYFHLLCHCGRSRLLLSSYLIRTSLFSPQILIDLHLPHRSSHTLAAYLPNLLSHHPPPGPACHCGRSRPLPSCNSTHSNLPTHHHTLILLTFP